MCHTDEFLVYEMYGEQYPMEGGREKGWDLLRRAAI